MIVICNGRISDCQFVRLVVPQGLILGLSISVNDLPDDNAGAHLTTYHVSTAVTLISHSISDLEKKIGKALDTINALCWSNPFTLKMQKNHVNNSLPQ